MFPTYDALNPMYPSMSIFHLTMFPIQGPTPSARSGIGRLWASVSDLGYLIMHHILTVYTCKS